jgi:sterol desaturase/sphingolipid hydroxylase (fatty acid hydroxylase superfamily)
LGEFLLEHHGEVYSVAFFAAITLIAVWEGIAPRREGGAFLRRRWGGNIGLAVINVALIHLIVPVAAVGFALVVEAHGIGLLHWIDSPIWIAAIVGFLAIDLGRYVHHYLLHRLPVLWRVHRIHHADLDYDFTVGLRFHPIEGLFTTAFAFAVIALVGAPPIAVLAAEVLVAISGTFVHANGRTPRWVESHVRRILVTPDMHRIHHSVRPDEHNSNYAAILSVWDRLFGTYVAHPAGPHETMDIGLPDLRDPACLNLGWMLITPLRRYASPPPPAFTRPPTETRW